MKHFIAIINNSDGSIYKALVLKNEIETQVGDLVQLIDYVCKLEEIKSQHKLNTKVYIFKTLKLESLYPHIDIN